MKLVSVYETEIHPSIHLSIYLSIYVSISDYVDYERTHF